jgi:2-polyprenyl-3-methyl-5-hydroxy-6-metoxy-1,4-benzoquinol methylase
MLNRCILCAGESIKLIHEKRGYCLGKCGACGLVFVTNPPGKEELAQAYTFSAGYHNTFQDEKSADFRNHSKLATRHYAFIGRYVQKGKILDVGCSVGCLLNLAGKNGWVAVGTELSKDTAAIGREKYGLTIAASSFDDFKHEGPLFDVISMWDVIEHLPDPGAAARKVYSLLNPGGLFILSTPNIDGAFPKLSYYISKIIKRWPHPEPPHHLFQFSATTLSHLLRQANFSLVDIVHERIEMKCSFGNLNTVLRSLRALLYAALFAPIAYSAPFWGKGDSMIVVARKGATDSNTTSSQ